MITTFKEFINESINDRGIFKAVFIIGIPGAGKSYTISKISGSIQPRIVNTDRAAEFLSKKFGKEITSDSWPEFKDSAHKITKNALWQYLNGMLPLFIDGTSNDASNILHRIGILESLGYDVGIIHVKTPLDVAIKRAKERALKNGRHVDEDFIKQVHSRNNENVEFLKTKVSFYDEIDNSDDMLTNAQLEKAFKKSLKFFMSDVKNPVGRRILAEMKEKKSSYLSPDIILADVLERKVDGWYKR